MNQRKIGCFTDDCPDAADLAISVTVIVSVCNILFDQFPDYLARFICLFGTNHIFDDVKADFAADPVRQGQAFLNLTLI